MTTQRDNSSVVRRSLLGVLPVVALGACRSDVPPASPPAPVAAGGGRPLHGGAGPDGVRQAGVDRPAQPQAHAVVSVYDLPPEAGSARVAAAALGEAVLELTGSRAGAALGVEAGDLTVTVGLGPRMVGAAGRGLPGGLDLPAFAREERTARTWGGDLLVQVCASDPVALALADTRLAGVLAAEGVSGRWSQAGFRPPGGGPVRNLLGFPDGIENPRTRPELDREVWLDGPGPLAGGTVAVVRRLRIDVTGFLAQSASRQEEAIGRRKADGAPLSGGAASARLDLLAKTARGGYLVPAMAHARRANPNATGSGRMLRRGYSYRNGPEDQGLLFLSFQRRLRTFTATQRRLDDGDDLMRFVTATASGAFFVPRASTPERPFGSGLLGEQG
ncbi:Dyp-type peroxidase [Streptomyces katrae]|uniref:Dyp-type peroxidase n=1 Tax=Streptomyces katrae TaxID=68223 RepID=A0ABT7GNM3_9ACTN|nr:Dyp-type peroxidase [Streptomyces katrae]MDK9495182.1 Dyp-type peroxidase [Streptomyces katrae]